MSSKEKLWKRLLSRPKDFSFHEMRRLFLSFGFVEDQGGKTSGSYVRFIYRSAGAGFAIHKPHPVKSIKEYQIDEAIDFLTHWRIKNEKHDAI